MILILSDKNDLATYRVAKNLESLGKNVLIITDEDEINDIKITSRDIEFSINNSQVNFRNIEAYWYRRGNFNLPTNNTNDLDAEAKNDLNLERSLTIDLFHLALLKKPCLGSIFNADLNRVSSLWKAQECELKIPAIGLFNAKKDLVDFRGKYKKIIIKPLGSGLNFIKDNKLFVNYTSLYSDEEIEGLPEYFPSALFMEYVEKKYEVRVFYIDSEFYSLATFSQYDPKTEVDYRRYNKERPNRNASFLLPGEIQMKLNILMKSLGLKTGSIDIIVTPGDEFVFLEVNPVGQFLNIEELGNYNLCGKIAGYLTRVANANKEMNGTIYN